MEDAALPARLPGTGQGSGRWILAAFAAVCVVAGALAAQALHLVPLGLIAIAVALFLVDRPALALCAATFLLFSNMLVVGSTFHGLPKVVNVLVPLLLLPAAWARMRVADRRLPAETVPMLGLLAVYLVSTAFSRDPAGAWTITVEFFLEGFSIFLLTALAVRNRLSLEAVSWSLLAAGAFLGVFPLFQQLTGSFETNLWGFGQVSERAFGTGIPDEGGGELGQHRLLGAIGEQNRFSQVMLLLLPIAALRVLYARGVAARTLALGATALIAAGFALAFSRGGAASLFFTALCGIGMRIVSWRTAAWLAGVGVVVLALLPQYRARLATLPAAFAIFDRESRTTQPDMAVKGRATQMLAAGMVYLDHPVVGVGPGQFKFYSQEYGNRLDIRRLKSTRESHNLVLGLAADLGTAGLVFFAWVTCSVFLRLLRARRILLGRDPPLAEECSIWALVWIAYMASGLFLHLSYIRFFWFLLGVASAAASLGSTRAGLDVRLGAAHPSVSARGAVTP